MGLIRFEQATHDALDRCFVGCSDEPVEQCVKVGAAVLRHVPNEALPYWINRCVEAESRTAAATP